MVFLQHCYHSEKHCFNRSSKPRQRTKCINREINILDIKFSYTVLMMNKKILAVVTPPYIYHIPCCGKIYSPITTEITNNKSYIIPNWLYFSPINWINTHYSPNSTESHMLFEALVVRPTAKLELFRATLLKYPY